MSTLKLQKNNFRKGFTLVETLVAITVLLLVIIGPMTVAQKGIQNAYYANDQVTAVFLAQEAIEAIRELRDTKALDKYTESPKILTNKTSDWYDSLDSDCTDLNTGCAFDLVNEDGGTFFEKCSPNNNACKLKYDTDNSNNFIGYDYTAGKDDSIFTRKVYVGTPTNGGVPVTVKVTWNAKVFGGAAKTVVLQTWLYDHYQRYEE